MPTRSNGRSISAAFAALSVTLLSGALIAPARADGLQAARLDTERFRPSIDGNAGFATTDATVPELGRFAVGLTLHNAVFPVVLVRESGERVPLVSNRLAGVVSGIVGVGGPVAVGLSIPVTFFQAGSLSALPASVRPSGSSELGIAGFGDLLLSPRIGLLREADHGIDLALDGSLTIPTGRSDAFQGDGGLGGLVSATLGRTFGSVRLLLLVGARFRPSSEVLSLQVGNELALRFAAIQKLPFGDAPYMPREIIGEVDLATLLVRPFEPLTSPGEWRVGARLCPIPNLAVTVGAGGGLTPAYGTPFARAIVAVGWEPRTCALPPAAPPVDAPAPVLPAEGASEEPAETAGAPAEEGTPGLSPDEGCAEGELCDLPIEPLELPTVDSDGDGIPDETDACPAVAGLPEFGGCPDPSTHDSDGDGIPDAADACPTQPGPVAHGGCPIPDRDGDGVPDEQDVCPDESGPARTGGCPPRPGDRDGDGIDDTHDRCPLQAGVSEAFGCPLTDTDSDGIRDHEDNCPTQPGTAANHGCTTAQRVKLAGNRIDLLEPIPFRQRTAELDSRGGALLDDLARVLVTHPELPHIRIEGHLDDDGSGEALRNLGRDQARAVVAALVQRGVDSSRLEAVGVGADKPIASNATSKGRRANRRIEIWIVGRSAEAVEALIEASAGMDATQDFLELEVQPLVPVTPAVSTQQTAPSPQSSPAIESGSPVVPAAPARPADGEPSAPPSRTGATQDDASTAAPTIDDDPLFDFDNLPLPPLDTLPPLD